MSDVKTAKYAWSNAERRVFNYLNQTLGLIEGLSFYIADEIKGAINTDNLKMLSFELSGNGETIRISPTVRPCPTRKMAGKLTGYFTKRKDAQELTGMILDVVPCGQNKDGTSPEGLDGIQIFTPVSEPVIASTVIPVLDDIEGTRGGEIQCWQLDWEFECVFNNTEQLQ
jgi:hypothetical protein